MSLYISQSNYTPLSCEILNNLDVSIALVTPSVDAPLKCNLCAFIFLFKLKLKLNF
jgi:hypothetical protein